MANGLLAMGVRAGDGVAMLARNHRWFVIANFGAARVGARIILLNSEFSGPQIKEVSEREGAKVIIYDDEYTKAVSKAEPKLGKLRALGTNPDADEPSGSTDETLEELIARSSKEPAPKAGKHASIIILTSGTTGTPKGANRSTPPTLAPVGGILSHVPFKAGEVTSLPSPMFHALGYLHGTLGMFLGSTLLLRRKFKPPLVLEDIEKHKATAMVVVPVMLSRILDAVEKMDNKPDLSSLQVVFVSGSAIGCRAGQPRAQGPRPGHLQHVRLDRDRVRHDRRSPSTSSATPRRSARWSRASRSRSSTKTARSCRRARSAGSSSATRFPFEGYTGGGNKQIIDGLLSSGDVGYFDEHGLLYISGRDDEMIVSGGENVFPAEVEDCISGASRGGGGHRDRRRGQGVGPPAARLRGQEGQDAEPGRGHRQAHVRDQLARYKVPREVVFLDELPRNPTGKILKRELREIDVD